MKKTDLSPEAQEVWKTLTQRQKKRIQKGNLPKETRDIEIFRLRNMGVKMHILAEITGLSRVRISRIVSGRKKIDFGKLSNLKRDLKELQQATGRIGHHISEIEKNI